MKKSDAIKLISEELMIIAGKLHYRNTEESVLEYLEASAKTLLDTLEQTGFEPPSTLVEYGGTLSGSHYYANIWDKEDNTDGKE